MDTLAVIAIIIAIVVNAVRESRKGPVSSPGKTAAQKANISVNTGAKPPIKPVINKLPSPLQKPQTISLAGPRGEKPVVLNLQARTLPTSSAPMSETARQFEIQRRETDAKIEAEKLDQSAAVAAAKRPQMGLRDRAGQVTQVSQLTPDRLLWAVIWSEAMGPSKSRRATSKHVIAQTIPDSKS